MKYELFEPAAPRFGGWVVIAHGFLRPPATTRGWATSLREAGVPVALIGLCNSSLVNGAHLENADDMRALARLLEPGPVVYAGFSAGGYAAMMAAVDDPGSAGFVGLDPVADDDARASAVSSRLAVPALVFLAEPASCNRGGSIRPALERSPKLEIIDIPGSSHCDFENPTDWVCEFACPRQAASENGAATREAVADRVARWLVALRPR